MPRYFFNIYDGVALPDLEGTELPDIRAVQGEAIRRSGAVIADEPSRVKLGEDWRMEVKDEKGLILFQLDFYISATAATMMTK